MLITSDPHVDRGRDSKHEQKQYKHERFHVVRRHSFYTKQNRAQQFAL